MDEVVRLASRLIRIPSVTACAGERRDEVRRCAALAAGLLEEGGVRVRRWSDGPYPAFLAGFPDRLLAPVTLCGHLDVVAPEPDDRQFEARIDGDWLWGRGAADMKTVVATFLVWMRRIAATGPPYPPVNLLVVGNEENGEAEPWGTPHVLADLHAGSGWRPELMVVGERTGEGARVHGDVCTASRGVLRFRLEARSARGHIGTGTVAGDLLDRVLDARRALEEVFGRRLRLSSDDGWQTTVRYPFVQVGEVDMYNVSPGEGILGVEIRPIPEEPLEDVVREAERIAAARDLELAVPLNDAGQACPEDNPHLQALVGAVTEVMGSPVRLGRKLAGSSARFAPGGNAVVWGQSGIGPHAADERHYIPSIGPYLEALDAFARRLG